MNETVNHCSDNLRLRDKRQELDRRLAVNARSMGNRCSVWRCVLWMLMLLCTAFSLNGTPSVCGQDKVVDLEYRLKAAHIYKFATYIRWPDKAFASESSPFVIAVLGPNPVGDDLRKIAATKRIDGRRIVVRHFEQPGDVRDCHILFMTKAVEGEVQKAVMQRLSGHGVLFVGETKEFLRHGGVIDFLVQGNLIRLYISKRAYEREGLNVSAQLLRIMTVL